MIKGLLVGIGTLLAAFAMAYWFLPERESADLEFARDLVWLREVGVDAVVEAGADLPEIEMLLDSQPVRKVVEDEMLSSPDQELAEPEMDLDAARVQWRQFRSLPKEEQRRIHRVYSQFQKLDPNQQHEVRDWVSQWLHLPESQRVGVRHRLQKWTRASVEEKAEALDRWNAATEEP